MTPELPDDIRLLLDRLRDLLRDRPDVRQRAGLVGRALAALADWSAPAEPAAAAGPGARPAPRRARTRGPPAAGDDRPAVPAEGRGGRRGGPPAAVRRRGRQGRPRPPGQRAAQLLPVDARRRRLLGPAAG